MKLYPLGSLKDIFDSKVPNRPHVCPRSTHVHPPTTKKNPWSYPRVAQLSEWAPWAHMNPHTPHTQFYL